MQEVQDLLTENQVIECVQNFLYQKGHTTHRRVVTVADAARKEHGVDLVLSWKMIRAMATGISLKQRAI